MTEFLSASKIREWGSRLEEGTIIYQENYNSTDAEYLGYLDSLIKKYNVKKLYGWPRAKFMDYSEHPESEEATRELEELLTHQGATPEEIAEIKEQVVIKGRASRENFKKYVETFNDKEDLKSLKKAVANLNKARGIFRDKEGNSKAEEAARKIEEVLKEYLAHLD